MVMVMKRRRMKGSSMGSTMTMVVLVVVPVCSTRHGCDCDSQVVEFRVPSVPAGKRDTDADVAADADDVPAVAVVAAVADTRSGKVKPKVQAQ
jgi:hypothetical protein